MENFNYNISTKVLFGKSTVDKLGKETKKIGNKVLLVYGKNSIKKNGLYQKVMEQLEEEKIEVFELSGVDPNPRIETVYEGAKICREKGIDLILAVGGGSTIDCSKGIAAQAKYEGDIWEDCYSKKDARPIKEALPIATILTLSATGSEMNGNSVISNLKVNKKLSIGSNLLRPVFSILDPTYTFSVGKYQTASGVADIMSHLFEQYFSIEKDGFLQNRMIEGILKTVIHFGTIAYNEAENYEARANLMWSSSLALNGLLTYGKKSTDWSSHAIEHELSAFYDVTHGVGLAVITPYWMDYVLSEDNLHRFVEYGKNVWNLDGNDMEIAKESIRKTREYFNSLGLPESLSELNIDDKYFDKMAEQAVSLGKLGSMKKLEKNDVLNILEAAL